MNNAEIAKCLAEVSALVAAGHPYEKCVQSRYTQEYIKRLHFFSRSWKPDAAPDWTDTDFEFRVAKGFVTGGNPIFDGMEFYNLLGFKLIACEEMRGDPSLANCTLTPPKPKVEIPEDTVTVRYDLSPAATEGTIRNKLIELGWTPPAADTNPKVEIPEGYTEWHGGECPVAGGVLVTALLRNGTSSTWRAAGLGWNHTAEGLDIIAYKIHKPTTFTLNGEMLPLPDCVRTYNNGDYWHVAIGNDYWAYANKADADKVRAAFAKLTEGV